MSDQQFTEVLTRLGGLEGTTGGLGRDIDTLKTSVAVLQTDVDGLKTSVAGLQTDVDGLKTSVAGLKTSVAGLKTDVAGLKTDVAGLKVDVKDVRRHMGVLHEEVLDRIRGLGEHDSLRQEMRAGFAELRQLFIEHTVPGEAADRHFASTLADHERRLTTLEGAKGVG